MRYKVDPTRVEFYAETGRRRYLVGILSYQSDKDNYAFQYEDTYMKLRSGIPMGPDLPYKRGRSKANPAECLKLCWIASLLKKILLILIIVILKAFHQMKTIS